MIVRRIGFRARLFLAVFGCVALALAASVAAFYALLGQRLDASATSLVKAQADTELASLDVRGGRLVARERGGDGSLAGEVWVFAGKRAIDSPRAPRQFARVARSLAGKPAQLLDLREQARFYSLPVVTGGVRRGTVVAALSLAPYEETGRAALIGAIALSLLVLLAVAILAHWVLGRALRPVAQMTRDASAWSERDLNRRFDLGPPHDDLTLLGATLDGLLDRIAASLRHEQRFTAEVAHEIRTPLARIATSAELMLRRERTAPEYQETLGAIHTNAEEMSRTVEALVSAARQEAGLVGLTCDIRDPVALAVATAREQQPAIDIQLDAPTDEVRVSVEPELVERMLQPLIANALQYGGPLVHVSVRSAGRRARVDVADDGPGVQLDERDRIFEPGARGVASNRRPGGAGLGLSLARRLARSAGGDIVALADSAGGRFSLELPLAR